MPTFDRALDKLNNYDLIFNKQDLDVPVRHLTEASSGSRVINVSRLTPFFQEVFYTAHMAACCVLNKDKQYSISDMKNGTLMNKARQIINSSEYRAPEVSRKLMQDMNSMDSVRTMQLLRLSGLITRHDSTIRHLALGAGDGIKDVFLHATPVFRIIDENGDQKIHFDYVLQRAENIIINDSDPRFDHVYKMHSHNKSQPIEGYIIDTMELLAHLSDTGIQKRNLITMLRVEPEMIPDLTEFLKLLVPIIDLSCDFIFSIGAGDNVEAYQRRIEMIATLFDIFNNKNLEPVLFQMHHGGTAFEQGGSLQFGCPATSAYEILYCRLNPVALSGSLA